MAERQIEHRKSCLVFSARFPVQATPPGPRGVVGGPCEAAWQGNTGSARFIVGTMWPACEHTSFRGRGWAEKAYFPPSLVCTQTLFYFSFRSFRKHRRPREGEERARKARKRERKIFFFSHPYSLALAVNKSPAVFIFYHARSWDLELKTPRSCSMQGTMIYGA